MKDVVFTRSLESHFIIERLPDGSAAIFDTTSEAVHSLNASAVVAWDRCVDPATPADIAGALADAGLQVTDAIALDTLEQLERAGLVARVNTIVAAPLMSSRRSLLKAAVVGSAALALPMVLTLTGAEQRVYAQQVGSPTATTTAAPTTPPVITTTPAPPTTIVPTTPVP